MFALDVEDRNEAAPKLAAEIERRKADGVLALGTGGTSAALDAKKLGGRSARAKIGTFDLTPEVLEAIKRRARCCSRSTSRPTSRATCRS